MLNWKDEIRQRVGDVEPAVLEELAQHLEARYEELQSYDAVMSEWNADELRAKLAAIERRRRPAPPVPGQAVAGISHDLRYGLRQLRMNPGFAAVAILSLALGIGANTAIFQLLDAVRLRALPVDHPENLATVQIVESDGRCCEFSSRYPQMTNALWEQVRDHQQAFSGIFAWGPDEFNLADGGEAHLSRNGLWVSGDFFNVLGVRPLLGRVLTAADDQRGCAGNVVLGYGFWQREFGGERTVVGKKLLVNSHPLEIVGVTPASFYGVEVGRAYDFALPLCADPIVSGEETKLNRRDTWWLAVMGRLKPGWSVERASAHVRAVSPALFEATVDPSFKQDAAKHFLANKLGVLPAAAGLSELRGEYEDPLWLLLIVAGLVLLIACANLANLLLARASAREREIAVRLALGASRPRLIRQLLLESLLLAVLGSAAGAVLAFATTQWLVAFVGSGDNPIFVDLGADWRLFAFLAGAALVTCVLFGLMPALRATRTTPGAAMKAAGRGFSGRNERFGLRRMLVVSQVALSLLLLVGSLLFVRTLHNLMTLDAGFQQNGIVVAQLDFDKLRVPAAGRVAFRRDMLERVRAIPGVDAAATASLMPVFGGTWSQPMHVEEIDGSKDKSPKENPGLNRVSAGYFKTLGTPLLMGRDFDDRDTLSSPLVAIVSEAFARKHLNGGNPIGRRFFLGDAAGTSKRYEIVGMVKDSKYGDLREKPRALAYFPAGQDARPDTYAQIAVRSSLPLPSLLAALRAAMQEVSPNLSFEFQVLQTQIRKSLGREQLMAALSSAFGLLAMVLVTVGLYGVISYSVARRTQEIGIRMALGADRLRIAGMILREGVWLLGAGLALGAVLALFVVRSAEKMLYGLTPQDPFCFATSAALLALVAALATFLPARRASALDPMAALRDE